MATVGISFAMRLALPLLRVLNLNGGNLGFDVSCWFMAQGGPVANVLGYFHKVSSSGQVKP